MSRDLVVTIVMCSWCQSPKPLEVKGAEGIPPGTHDAKLQVSHGICIPCGTKFTDEIGEKKGGVTQPYTLEGEHTSEESQGS